jgi:hypothetical protein
MPQYQSFSIQLIENNATLPDSNEFNFHVAEFVGIILATVFGSLLISFLLFYFTFLKKKKSHIN